MKPPLVLKRRSYPLSGATLAEAESKRCLVGHSFLDLFRGLAVGESTNPISPFRSPNPALGTSMHFVYSNPVPSMLVQETDLVYALKRFDGNEVVGDSREGDGTGSKGDGTWPAGDGDSVMNAGGGNGTGGTSEREGTEAAGDQVDNGASPVVPVEEPLADLSLD